MLGIRRTHSRLNPPGPQGGLFRETAPLSRLLRHTWDTENTFLTLPPGPLGDGRLWDSRVRGQPVPSIFHSSVLHLRPIN